MELRHLRYFVAVADELSFRKAAERLRVSRPALSKQIKNLEEETGVRLLDRDTANVALTKAGEVFLEDARKLLEHAVLAVKRAREAEAGHRGKLLIGSVGVIATDFLPGTLKTFHDRYPDVEVEFVEMLPLEQLDALSEGRIDIAFAYGQEAVGNTGHRSLCVIRSTFGLAVSRHHPWAGRESVRLAEIEEMPVICLGQGPRSVHREDVCRFCQDEGFSLRRIRSVEGFDSLLNLIAADQGVTLLPRVLGLTPNGIVILPLTSERATYDFRMWAVWQQDSPSKLVKHFVQILEKRYQPDG